MSLTLPVYKELTLNCNKETATLWVGMNPIGRQCFTLSMLVELLSLLHRLDKYGSPDPAYPDIIHYLVFQSEHPDIYNLGGDLEYFSALVKQQDSARLKEYGIICIDLIYWALTGGKNQITVIANIAGDTLGGGFEAALASRYIFAEKGTVFSFPESLFGFFPGMGAYDLFRRFSGSLEADKAFTTGKRYSAEELKLMGGIYSLVERGQGAREIEKFIANREKNQSPHRALQRIKQYQQSITYESLEFSIDLWVEAAMKLTERNLRMMSILTRRQKKKGSADKLKPKFTRVHQPVLQMQIEDKNKHLNLSNPSSLKVVLSG